MFRQKDTSNINILLFGVATMAAVIIQPEIAAATTPVSTATGFGQVAYQIYDNLDGALGMIIGLTGGGIILASMVRGLNGIGIASGAGIGLKPADARSDGNAQRWLASVLGDTDD